MAGAVATALSTAARATLSVRDLHRAHALEALELGWADLITAVDLGVLATGAWRLIPAWSRPGQGRLFTRAGSGLLAVELLSELIPPHVPIGRALLLLSVNVALLGSAIFVFVSGHARTIHERSISRR